MIEAMKLIVAALQDSPTVSQTNVRAAKARLEDIEARASKKTSKAKPAAEGEAKPTDPEPEAPAK